MLLFIILQCLLLIFMLFHDWIPVSPYNDIEALKRVDSNSWRLFGSFVNSMPVIIGLIYCFYYNGKTLPFFAGIILSIIYGILTVGTIFSWWIPYFFGSSKKYKIRFQKFKNTHHFLPARGDNVIPNTLHVVLHLQVWMCFIFALYYSFV